MKFTHYKLGHVAAGTVVEVTLQGSAANVRLMDRSLRGDPQDEDPRFGARCQ